MNLIKKINILLPIFILSFQANADMPLSSIEENGSSETFDSYINEGPNNPDVGVVLLHGRKHDPDGPVVKQLRYAFFSAGYTTLSISNPHALSENSGKREFPDYVADATDNIYAMEEAYARIRSAINHLESLGISKIVLLGVGMGSRFASAHIKHGQIDELSIVGFIGITMYATSIDPLNHADNLSSVTVPVLDVFADIDWGAVGTLEARQTAYAGDAANYTVKTSYCENGLSRYDCGLFVRNISSDGTECRFLEFETINWITTTVPLAEPPSKQKGLGVCENGLSPEPEATNLLSIDPVILALCALLLSLSHRFKFVSIFHNSFKNYKRKYK